MAAQLPRRIIKVSHVTFLTILLVLVIFLVIEILYCYIVIFPVLTFHIVALFIFYFSNCLVNIPIFTCGRGTEVDHFPLN